MSTHANRVKMTVTSVASAGTGDITLNAASSGFRSFATAYGANATVDILITEGTAWEIARNCTYTHSGTTVSRGTLESSSTESAVAFTSAAVVSVIATAALGNSLEAQSKSYITGLTIEYASTSSITASAGAAYIESLGYVYNVASAITKTGLTGLTASTLYYVYLYDDSGTPALDVSTTAPASTAFAGTARSKNGDTTRRYLGSFRTTSAGSSNVSDFATYASGANSLTHVYRDNDVSFSRVVNGAAKTTSATSVSLASLCPAAITTKASLCVTASIGAETNQFVEVVIGVVNSASFRVGVFGFMIASSGSYPALCGEFPLSPATPLFYWYNQSSTATTSAIYIDLLGYTVTR